MQEDSVTLESTIVTIENDHQRSKMPRPDSLILNTTTIEAEAEAKAKYLYRSQSTKTFKKPRPKASKGLSNDLDQIYVISSNSSMRPDLNDFYDDFDVIHERRNKNFSKFTDAEGRADNEAIKPSTRNDNLIETTVDIEPQRMN